MKKWKRREKKSITESSILKEENTPASISISPSNTPPCLPL
jgi:hypothetical protein